MADPANVYKVGDFELVINAIEVPEGDLSDNYRQSDLTNTEAYLVFDLSVKNSSDSDVPIGNFVNFRLLREDDSAVQPIVLEEDGFDVNVPKGTSMRGKLNYKITLGEPYHFRFCPNLIQGDYIELPVTVG